MAAETLKGDDYKTNFDIDWYVKFYYSTPLENPEEGDTTYTFLLDELHKTFSSGKVRGRRFLEFGSGPTVHTLFSARNAVEEIICCEFAECNRKQIEKWWKKECGACDWSVALKHVAQLEQHRDHERIAAEVREKLQEILPCDVRLQNPLSPNIREPYDVIMTSFTLEAACESIDQYNKAVANVSSLIRQGGHLIMFGALCQTFYVVNKEHFFSLRLEIEDIENALKLAGFEDIETKVCPIDRELQYDGSDCEGLFYTTSKKR